MSQSVKFFAGPACRYSVVKTAALKMGWKLIDESASEKEQRSCNVLWIDTSPVQSYFTTIKPWQRINHFPGMVNIARKTRLAENLEMMKKGFEKEYAFFPTTYIIPRDLATMKEEVFGPSGKCKETLIVKPDGGAQGKGIFLTKNLEDIENLKNTHVAQTYIPNPYLIDGKKFDLRIYVLITCCDPLRIYLFKDGLVRLCTEDFVKPNAKNMEEKCMHLTNFSINRQSEQYEGSSDDSGDSGSKRSITWFLSWLSGEMGSDLADQLWDEIGDICVKTVLSIAPILVREYNSTFGLGSKRQQDQNDSKTNSTKILGSRSFAVLGIDVMIDSHCKPHLIEVNHLSSFATGSPIDESIKSRVIYQALSVLKCASTDQQSHESEERKRRMDRRSSIVHAAALLEKQAPKTNATSRVNVEEFVTEIYAKYAPEKLDKVDALLQKYHGYEDLLVRRLEEKYQKPLSQCNEAAKEGIEIVTNDNDCRLTTDYDSCDSSYSDEEDSLEEYEALVECGDYDRIYPPCMREKEKLDMYRKMKKHACEHDEKEQKRLTCPLWLQRSHQKENIEVDTQVVGKDNGHVSTRCEWMFNGGNIHIKRQNIVPKLLQPPSQKQVEAAERLSKGYSVEDRNIDGSNVGSVNDSFIHRLSKAEDIGKERRKWNEVKCSSKTQLQMSPINLEFTHPFETEGIGDKYYFDFAGRKLGT